MTTMTSSQVEAVVSRAQQLSRLSRSERALLVRSGAKSVLASDEPFRSRSDVEAYVGRVAASFGAELCREVADEVVRRMVFALSGGSR